MDTSTKTSLDTTNRPGATAQDHDDPVMTAKEAAAFLGVSPWTLYAAANRHEVPHRRLGRRMLFLRSALKAWLRGASPRNAV
jgi:excisionase family DNA binding protein